jgi:ligand-binding sensor domain-containing protein
MWFGTEDGLNKYDGYKFTIYKNDAQDSTSISDNWITSLFEDHTGTLWVGTSAEDSIALIATKSSLPVLATI